MLHVPRSLITTRSAWQGQPNGSDDIIGGGDRPHTPPATPRSYENKVESYQGRGKRAERTVHPFSLCSVPVLPPGRRLHCQPGCQGLGGKPPGGIGHLFFST